MFSIVSPRACVLPVSLSPGEVEDRLTSFAPISASGVAPFRNDRCSSERHAAEFLREESEFLSRCVDEMRSICEAHAFDCSCFGRVKNFTSTWHKMLRRGVGYGDIMDVIGVRIVMRNVEQCYQLLSHIRALYPRRTHSIRDYVAHPKGNGYRSLHVSILSYEQRRFEVQIRTADMDADCALGHAAHSMYKSGQQAFLSREVGWQPDMHRGLPCCD